MAWPPVVLIRPAPRSVVLTRDAGRPPTFEIIADEAGLDLEVELATEVDLFDFANHGARRSDANFFNSTRGRKASPAVSAARLVSVRSWRPSSAGPPSLPGQLLNYTIPRPIWAALLTTLVAYRGRELYYRVFARSQGRYVTTTPDEDAEHAPFVHVLDTELRSMYLPLGRALGSLEWLRVEGNRVVAGRRSTAQTGGSAGAARVLRGMNVSGLQYRRPDWPTQEKLAPHPGVPSRSHGCPVATGTDTCGTGHWYDAADVTERRLQEMADWGAQIIRLPVNQDWVLHGVRTGKTVVKSGLDYLRDLDCVIAWANAAKLYVLVTLYTTSNGVNAPLPDGGSLLFWAMIASRYRDQSGVLFDLINEPRPPTASYRDGVKAVDNAGSAGYRGVGAADMAGWIDLWHEWARTLVAVIHDNRPDGIVVISGFGGPAWGSDLRSYPVLRPGGSSTGDAVMNAAYSAHVYPVSVLQGTSATVLGTFLGDVDVSGRKRSRPLMADHPVFLGELGPAEGLYDTVSYTVGVARPVPVTGWPAQQKWLTELFRYIRGLQDPTYQGLAGWMVWSWGDAPHLVRRKAGEDKSGRCPCDRPFLADAQGRRVPTAFGSMARTELAAPVRAQPSSTP